MILRDIEVLVNNINKVTVDDIVEEPIVSRADAYLYISAWKNVLEILKNLPTVDVEPVRHAHWIEWQSIFEKNAKGLMKERKKMHVCSRCHMHTKGWETCGWCSHCGAKMDEVV